MISDKLTTFAENTAIPTATGTALVGDVIPLGANSNLNDVDDLHLVVLVGESVTSAGAATVNFRLATDSDPAFGSASILASSGDIGKAALVAGTRAWSVPIPKGALSEAYLGVQATVGTAALTAGKITAMLVCGGPNTYRAVADGILPGTG